MKHILVIDDEKALRLMVSAILEDAGWCVAEAANAEEALAVLEGSTGSNIRVILLDVGMPGMSGHDLLPLLRRNYSGIPVVMLTAFGTVGSAVEAMKNGAFDYLTKPADNDELVTVVEKALEQARLLQENTRLRERVAGNDPLAALVGTSAPMHRVHELIRQAGPSEATVLIMGESGTGKELIADALHAFSPRAPHAMIKVNCAALPPHLLESELFGYVKGAFTGAVKDKPGRFQLADKGSLFLDEIGEMPAEVQAKLLRVLQERIVEPLGSVRPVSVDVRIITATNRDLANAVQEGSFREDLYFRLNVLEIVAPPLRDRTEDLPTLVAALLQRLCKKNRKDIRGISPATLEVFGRYSWPGNVRELENVLERGVILSRSNILTPDALPEKILREQPISSAFNGQLPESVYGMEQVVASAERDALIRALDANNGHRERTAEALGISRRTLQYKLKKFGFTRGD